MQVGDEKLKYKVELDLSKQYKPNKDFQLLFKNGLENQPECTVAQMEKGCCAMITYVPDFKENINLDDAYQAYLNSTDILDKNELEKVKGEYIILLDRSGSMSGNRIEYVRNSIIDLLNVMPKDSLFNIVSFGSEHQSMFWKSEKADESKKSSAINQLIHFEADMGGTEILVPLRSILEERAIQHYPKHVFVFTDGAVSNTEQVLELIRTKTKEARVHTIGIGNGCSIDLIRKMAFYGKGKSEFVEREQSFTETAIKLFEAAQSPCIDDFSLEADGEKLEELTTFISPNPNKLGFLLRDQPLVFFLFFKEEAMKKEKLIANLRLFDSSIDANRNFKIEIDFKKSTENFDIIKLGLHSEIRAIEDKYNKENRYVFYVKPDSSKNDEIYAFALKYGILSKKTAFFCEIEDRNDIKDAQLQTKVIVPAVMSIDYEQKFECLDSSERLMACAMMQKEEEFININKDRERWIYEYMPSLVHSLYQKYKELIQEAKDIEIVERERKTIVLIKKIGDNYENEVSNVDKELTSIIEKWSTIAKKLEELSKKIIQADENITHERKYGYHNSYQYHYNDHQYQRNYNQSYNSYGGYHGRDSYYTEFQNFLKDINNISSTYNDYTNYSWRDRYEKKTESRTLRSIKEELLTLSQKIYLEVLLREELKHKSNPQEAANFFKFGQSKSPLVDNFSFSGCNVRSKFEVIQGNLMRNFHYDFHRLFSRTIKFQDRKRYYDQRHFNHRYDSDEEYPYHSQNRYSFDYMDDYDSIDFYYDDRYHRSNFHELYYGKRDIVTIPLKCWAIQENIHGNNSFKHKQVQAEIIAKKILKEEGTIEENDKERFHKPSRNVDFTLKFERNQIEIPVEFEEISRSETDFHEIQAIVARQVLDFNQSLEKAAYDPNTRLYIKQSAITEGHLLSMASNADSEVYTDNFTGVNEELPLITAFSHFSYQNSNQTFLVCDIKGANNLIENYYLHSFGTRYKDSKDFGVIGMVVFFRNHKCNQYCDKLGLKPHPAQENRTWEVMRKPAKFSLEKLYKKCNFIICNNNTNDAKEEYCERCREKKLDFDVTFIKPNSV